VYIVLPPCGSHAVQDDISQYAFISAYDFDIVRNAFRLSVAEGLIAESHWIQHVRDLVRELTGHEDVDDSIVDRIVGR
jgi:hypothetical protein